MEHQFFNLRPRVARGGFFARSMRASLWMTLLIGLFGAVYIGYGFAGRYLLFSFWMLGSFGLWRLWGGELIGRRRFAAMAALTALKLLWLALVVGLCALVGIRDPQRFSAFLLGMTTPFLVIFLKALGLAITRRSRDHAADVDVVGNDAPGAD